MYYEIKIEFFIQKFKTEVSPLRPNSTTRVFLLTDNIATRRDDQDI